MVKKQSLTETHMVNKNDRLSQDDEVLQNISFIKLLHFNKPEWPIVLIGITASACIGVVFPAMAPLFSEILRVCT